jgi:hypothetical protein
MNTGGRLDDAIHGVVAPAHLMADDALRLAGHLAELAWLAAPGDQGIGRVRQEVFSARADTATSTMATGVFRWAAQESVSGA